MGNYENRECSEHLNGNVMQGGGSIGNRIGDKPSSLPYILWNIIPNSFQITGLPSSLKKY